jgi:hypothetical protein
MTAFRAQWTGKYQVPVIYVWHDELVADEIVAAPGNGAPAAEQSAATARAVAELHLEPSLGPQQPSARPPPERRAHRRHVPVTGKSCPRFVKYSRLL